MFSTFREIIGVTVLTLPIHRQTTIFPIDDRHSDVILDETIERAYGAKRGDIEQGRRPRSNCITDDTFVIDFDEASRAWRQNKKSTENGCFKYTCIHVLANGNTCSKTPSFTSEFCHVHKKSTKITPNDESV